jgi:DNA-binding transcriptional LysR family regulator
LDLRLVEYFVAVAEELHFGRAARRLHIAQPSLSQQIRRLEHQLDVMLLRRTSRRVELTPAGQALLSEGRRLLVEAANAARLTRAAETERLTVGFYGSAGWSLLPAVLRSFAESRGSTQVAVRELLLGDIDELVAGRVDVAFTRILPGQTELEVEVIAHERRLVALPANHRLATRTTLAFAELSEESFITNPVVQSAEPPTRWLEEQRRHGLPGRVAAEAASVQEILALVASGRGACLVPEPVASHIPRADVAFVEITDADPAILSLAWRPNQLRPLVAAFIDTTRRVAGGYELPPITRTG